MLNRECSSPVMMAAQKASYINDVVMEFVVFGFKKGQLYALLAGPSLHNQLHELPSGQIYDDEPLGVAARRINQQVTGLEFESIDQVITTSRVTREKMELSVGHCAFVSEDNFDSVVTYTANHFLWVPVNDLPVLADKNKELFESAFAQLKHRIRHEPISFSLLPKKFTLLQLQELYETVLAVKFDKPNFRRKVLSLKVLACCNEKEQNVSHRAANLYTYDSGVYKSNGVDFYL